MRKLVGLFLVATLLVIVWWACHAGQSCDVPPRAPHPTPGPEVAATAAVPPGVRHVRETTARPAADAGRHGPSPRYESGYMPPSSYDLGLGTGTIRGVVEREGSGPVEGAWVWIRGYRGGIGWRSEITLPVRDASCYPIRPEGRWRPYNLLTDENGLFEFCGLATTLGGFYKFSRLEMTTDDYAVPMVYVLEAGEFGEGGAYAQTGDVCLSEGEVRSVTLRLPPQGNLTVSGRVLAATGPVPGVRVEYTLDDGRELPDGSVHRTYLRFVAETDLSGTYRIGHVLPGAYDVLVESIPEDEGPGPGSIGFLRTQVDVRNDLVQDFVLFETVFSGFVVDAATQVPLSNAVVHLDECDTYMGADLFSAPTGEDGAFSFRWIPPGSYKGFVLTDAAHEVRELMIEVTENVAIRGYRIEVERASPDADADAHSSSTEDEPAGGAPSSYDLGQGTATIQGVVQREGGAPVQGAWVQIRGYRGTFSGKSEVSLPLPKARFYHLFTDAGGFFEFSGLATKTEDYAQPVAYRLLAGELPDGDTCVILQDVRLAEDEVRVVTVRLPPQGDFTVSGRVLAGVGPVGGVHVDFSLDDHERLPDGSVRSTSLWLAADTDSSGAYRIDNVLPGTYDVVLETPHQEQENADGAYTGFLRTRVDVKNNLVQNFVLFETEFSGFVVDAATQVPLSNAVVALREPDGYIGADFSSGPTAEDGAFCFRWIRPGLYTLSVWTEVDAEDRQETIEVTEDVPIRGYRIEIETAQDDEDE